MSVNTSYFYLQLNGAGTVYEIDRQRSFYFLHIKYHTSHCHNVLNMYLLAKYLGYYLEIELDCVDLRFSQ
jgi:hypothetical protein